MGEINLHWTPLNKGVLQSDLINSVLLSDLIN